MAAQAWFISPSCRHQNTVRRFAESTSSTSDARLSSSATWTWSRMLMFYAATRIDRYCFRWNRDGTTSVDHSVRTGNSTWRFRLPILNNTSPPSGFISFFHLELKPFSERFAGAERLHQMLLLVFAIIWRVHDRDLISGWSNQGATSFIINIYNHSRALCVSVVCKVFVLRWKTSLWCGDRKRNPRTRSPKQRRVLLALARHLWNKSKVNELR